MASYRVEVSKSAERDLRKIERKWIEKIFKAIESLEDDPRPSGCKRLVGSEQTYRIRVSDYRVIYEIHDATVCVVVIRIRHRRDAYR